MNKFERPVDRDNKQAMVDFLTGHFRYDTMNSWNGATSYAHNIKLHHLKQPRDISDDTWYELFTLPEWADEIGMIFTEFAERYNYSWQAGTNGRSGGYIVLYAGGRKDGEHKSYCQSCGQRNFQTVPAGEIGVCGKCREPHRVNYNVPPQQVYSYPGRGVDMDEDFESWDTADLQARVDLICDFDRMCDTVVAAYVAMCRENTIVDESYPVMKTIRRLEPR